MEANVMRAMLILLLVLNIGCGASPHYLNSPHPIRVQLVQDVGPVIEQGETSWYGGRFHGRRTSSREVFNKHAMTAAHKTLPFGTIVEVTDVKTNRKVRVRINDRGPFIKGRILDLSHAAAIALGIEKRGKTKVQLRIVRG